MNQNKNEYQKTNYSNNSYQINNLTREIKVLRVVATPLLVNINGYHQGFPKENGLLSGGNRLLHYYNLLYTLTIDRNLLATLTIFSLIYPRISDISKYTLGISKTPIIISGGLLWQH